jgi:Mn2+/Fe2+ NRAMP family transporter
VYLFILVSSGLVVLIPGAPLITITMFVQVVAVTLLPSTLVFLIILLNDKGFMGEHVNTRKQNVANISIVVFVTIMSTVFAITTLFPKWLGGK